MTCRVAHRLFSLSPMLSSTDANPTASRSPAASAEPETRAADRSRDRRTAALEWILLALILLLGAFLRFHRLPQLPPGDGYDVAQYGVDALEILAGARPVFLEANFGREPLFSYLVALAYLVVGPGTLGIRLAGALIGTLTIAANYLAARELFFESHGILRRYLPLLTALLSAVSYWHVNWSRLGLRVILVPLFASLIVFALWRAFRTGSRLWYAVAGALLGLSLYTYQAARLLPVLVAVAFALHGLLRRSWSGRDTVNLIVTAAFAALVALPLGIYALRHPGALSARIDQAVILDAGRPLTEQAGAVARQALTALLSYNVRGDLDPQFNIPGRPTLDPFLSLFFLLGIGVSLWRFRRPPYLFLLAWLLLMTAPAMIADLAAMAKRYLGAFPAAMMLIALGLLLPLTWLERVDRSRRRALQGLYVAFVALGLLYSGATAARDYFVVWAGDPDLPTHFQVEYRALGEYIGGLPPGETVWLSPYPADHPVIRLHSGLRPEVRSYNGRFCVPLPDPVSDRPTTYVIVPGLQDSSLARLQALFPQGTTEPGVPRPGSDRPYFNAFRLPAGAVTTPPLPDEALAVWDDRIELLQAEVTPATVTPGETVTIDLTYRAKAPPGTNYTAFVHVLGAPRPDTGSPLWAQSDSEPCGGGRPTTSWQPGDLLRDTVTLALPPDIAPGEYSIVTGFYSWPDLTRLTTADGADAVRLGTLQVATP